MAYKLKISNTLSYIYFKTTISRIIALVQVAFEQ